LAVCVNQRGHLRAENEKSLSELLEGGFFPRVFPQKDMYVDIKPQYPFAPSCKVDYFIVGNPPTLIEVKNWFVTICDMQQIMKYYVHATERYPRGFVFILIVGGIEKNRRDILERLGIQIILSAEVIRDFHA